MKSTTEKFKKELSALLRARYSLISVQSYEEDRCLSLLEEISQDRSVSLYVWSRTEGVMHQGQQINDTKDPIGVLAWYGACETDSLLVLKDFHPYLKEPTLVRSVRDLGRGLKNQKKNIIFLSPTFKVPEDLDKDITQMDLPIPSKEEISTLIQKAQQIIPQNLQVEVPANHLSSLQQSACGLTYDEIENVLAKSIVLYSKLDPKVVQDEKKQIVKKSGILEFIDTDVSQKSKLGGLTHLKQWFSRRKIGFTDKAENENLPKPKGILLVGVPGCGKSLSATSLALQWQVPLLRLDLGKVFSGLVGSSESNLRRSLEVADTISPCILWIDEIEKGLSGTQSSGSSDGGTSSRVFGTVLTWMQEKKTSVFVLATANDISGLPPEFLRKGRFDEIFFVDLPDRQERREILNIQLERYGWNLTHFEEAEFDRLSTGFSGAEIEQALIDAKYSALSREEELKFEDLKESMKTTYPLSKSMSAKIEALREWSTHRARPASSGSGTGTSTKNHSLDQGGRLMEIKEHAK